MAKSFSEILAERAAAKASAPAPASTPAPATVVKEAPVSFADKLRMAATNNPPTPEAPTPAVEVEKVVDTSPLPNVITAANLVNAGKEAVAIQDADAEATMVMIRQKISELATMEGINLKSAMDTLKGLLLSNPAACSFMLPEDSGLLVRALRRMTGNAHAASMASARATKKEKTVSDKVLLTNVNLDEW